MFFLFCLEIGFNVKLVYVLAKMIIVLYDMKLKINVYIIIDVHRAYIFYST